MDVELLVVPNCPNENAAAALLRTALDDIGLPGTTIRTTLIEAQHQAERRSFTGSPTILINGNDPFADPGQPTALACRTYLGPQGSMGLPTLPDLRQALKQAADTNRR